MRRGFALSIAAVLLASAPLTKASAQATPAAPQAAPAAPAEPAKPAPEKKPGITFTPYGFVLVNAYFDASPFATKDYPAYAQANANGGAFLMSARQSRFGFRIGLPEDGWTGAKVNLVLEADFKAGHVPTSATCAVPTPNTSGTSFSCTIGTANTASTAWYNGLMRLRLAYATIGWKTDYGNWTILAGQGYGLVNPLFATALAWTADPLFWQAGNIWRRSPQLRLTYDTKAGPVALDVALAALSPEDATTPVDFGAGNRSRMPDLEARIGATYKEGKTSIGLGLSGHYHKRRYVPTNTYAADFDATERVFGVDLDVNTQYAELKGEFFNASGADDTYNGIAPAVVSFKGTAAGGFYVRPVGTQGGWAQLIIRPVPEFDLYGGYGVEVASQQDLSGAAADSRSQNNMAAFGIIVNASKAWHFGAEYMNTISRQAGGTRAEGQQFAVSTKFDF